MSLVSESVNLQDYIYNLNPETGVYDFWDAESDNFIFKDEIKSNSKGVTKFKPMIDAISGYGRGEGSAK
jgi:hypothetical protein